MNKSTVPGMRLRPGKGVLARHDDIVLLCEIPPDAEAGVTGLLDEVKVAASHDQPGLHLVRHLVKTLAAEERMPSLCAFGVVDNGIAVAVHGRARLWVTTKDGELRLDGQGALTIVDRVVTEPVLSITGELGDEVAGFCDWSELVAGVVRADALQYGPATAPGPAPAEEEVGEQATQAEGPTEDAATDTDAAPSADTEEEAEAPRQEDGRSQVIGVRCAKGHFNDPTDQYCALCGIGLTQAGRRSAQQARPSLGVLVLDDGTPLPMNRDYIIGRAPESAAEKGDDEAVLLRLTDSLVSPMHARVRLNGWEVTLIDEGSTNGTFVREADSDWCVRVPKGGQVVLRPGSIVTVGRRQFRYDSYRRN